MKRIHLHLILALAVLVLSIVSFFVIMQGASNEPYIVFRKSDAIVQIGVAMMLMLLWFQLAIAMVAGVIRRRISTWCLSLLFWVLTCEFYLFYCPRGYIHDIVQNVAMSH